MSKSITQALQSEGAHEHMSYRGSGGHNAPVIYLIDSPEHPFDTGTLAQARSSTVVSVPVGSWSDALTPWPAKALYRGEPDFGGKADDTLGWLCHEAIPAIEEAEELSPRARAICGYSLGGLFALYALLHSGDFVACGCLSGSVWYEGWVDYLRSCDVDLTGSFAYLSLGTKERRAARPLLKTVQDRMESCASILEGKGATVCYRTGPGNHMQHIPERLAAGLSELDRFLTGIPGDLARHTL